MHRRIFGSFVRSGADFLLNGSGGCGRIFGCGNGSSDDNVSCARLDRFGGSHDSSLISVIGSGGANSGIHD